MRTRVHLISMPWADPDQPSIQTACLKAYLDKHRPELETRTYSGHLAISRGSRTDFYESMVDGEEYPYFILCARRFLGDIIDKRSISIERLVDSLSSFEGSSEITVRKLDHLERTTLKFLNEEVLPNIKAGCRNVVGLTLNYHQLYSSIFAARHLLEKAAGKSVHLVFGGGTSHYPQVATVLRNFDIPGLCAIGEGEEKLLAIVDACLEQECGDLDLKAISAAHPGIYSLQDEAINLFEVDRKHLKGQVSAMEDLPAPNYDEYFRTQRAISESNRAFQVRKYHTWIPMEGSRGCFAHCDFCDIHAVWDRFRRGSGQKIADNVVSLFETYRISSVSFMDNVCDTWAESYAMAILRQGTTVRSFMELRVHHPETFWTRLAMSGVELVQIGIEAFSPRLLEAMNKRTSVRQNIVVQKWLKELGVTSRSNLITHHPGSRPSCVRTTKMVLQQIPHLDKLEVSPLSINKGSPLYESLEPSERRNLQEDIWLPVPASLRRYFTLKGEYATPRSMLSKDTIAAWDNFLSWKELDHDPLCEGTAMTVREMTDCLIVHDERFDDERVYELVGLERAVYAACHDGPTVKTLARRLDRPTDEINKVLRRLVQEKLTLHIDGGYISLALRPRDELIRSVTGGYGSSAITRDDALELSLST